MDEEGEGGVTQKFTMRSEVAIETDVLQPSLLEGFHWTSNWMFGL